MAARANQLIAPWPCGSTIAAAKSGPMALPPLPPTWKMDCARLLRPPDANWAAREASGWKTDEPRPTRPTERSISARVSLMESSRSPQRVKHIPVERE